MGSTVLARQGVTRRQYERLITVGLLDSGDRVELLDGVLVAREPQGSLHAAVVSAACLVLQQAFGPRHHVRVAAPVALDDMSEPEPDLAVVRGRPRSYRARHPERPLLVVEVSETSLLKDRRRKGSLYARAGIEEYWVIDLVHDILEVHRQPVARPDTRYGWAYAVVRRLGRRAMVSPLAVPDARIRASRLLP